LTHNMVWHWIVKLTRPIRRHEGSLVSRTEQTHPSDPQGASLLPRTLILFDYDYDSGILTKNLIEMKNKNREKKNHYRTEEKGLVREHRKDSLIKER